MEAKGLVNAYTCEKCGGTICTVNLDAGVTPMFLACRAVPSDLVKDCDGSMVSAWYRGTEAMTPTWGWHQATPKQIRRMKRNDPAMADHCAQGGLLLRELTEEEQKQYRPNALPFPRRGPDVPNWVRSGRHG